MGKLMYNENTAAALGGCQTVLRRSLSACGVKETGMKDSLAEQVFRALEQEILNGVRRPGDALTELGLCEKYQVSRTPVREAMRRLETAGLVTVQPNRSAVVAGVSVQDMLDIYEIRMRIEGLAARWSALRITENELQALEKILDLQEFYTAKGKPEELHRLDADFHRALYSDCGSPMLTDTLTALHHRLQRFRRTSLSNAERAARSLAEHRAIYEALAAHDGEAAENLTVQHICHARDRLAALYHPAKEAT